MQRPLAVLRTLTLDRLTRIAWLCVLIALTNALLSIPNGIIIQHNVKVDHYVGFDPKLALDVTGRLEVAHEGFIGK